MKDRYNEWYNDLGPVQQQVADQIINSVLDHLNGLDPGNGQINYNINKKPVDKWNGGIGGQFQYNKHWMYRAEVAFIGNRTNVLLSANYRFGF